MTNKEIDTMTVNAMKTELKRLQLTVSGNKNQLQLRLKGAYENEENKSGPATREEIDSIPLPVQTENICDTLTVKQCNMMAGNKNDKTVINPENSTMKTFITGFRHQETLANRIAKHCDLEMITANKVGVTFKLDAEIVAKHCTDKVKIDQYFGHLDYCDLILEQAGKHFNISDVVTYSEKTKKAGIAGRVGTLVLKNAGIESDGIANIRANFALGLRCGSLQEALEYVESQTPVQSDY